MKNRYILVYCTFCLLLILLIPTRLNATQPFWSMEPSTQSIDRADSLTGFDIQKYTINLAINEQTHFIDGSVEAIVLAEETLSQIQYRLSGGTLSVSEVLVNGSPVAFTHQDGIVNIPLSAESGTTFTTRVSYSGVPGNSPSPYNIGLIFTSNTIYTLSNPDAGRYWWCSYDHPWDKALVDWNITVRSDWLAAANGTRTGITDNGDGTRTHHWVCSSPVATYVIGFAAGAYTEFNQQAGDIPIQNFVLPGQLNNAQADFANVPEMIACFSELFGPYPFEKYGHMVVNMATYAAMEHQTMTTFGSQYINGQQTYESIVAHELAHQWYGNYLTPLTMREVWLKESFATYSEALWVHHNQGWEAACEYLKFQIQQYYINWENSNGPHTIFNPEYNLMFAPPTYEKSASVLHMLRLKMGNEAFFPFIRALLTTYPNGNLITSEFIALAQQFCGQDLSQFFQQWIYSPGIPNVKMWMFTNGFGTAKVYAQSTSPTSTQFHLEVPLMLQGSAVADSVVVTATPQTAVNYFALGEGDSLADLQIDPHNWVLSRLQENVKMQLTTCLPYNSAVTLGWQELSPNIPISGYRVYRRTLPDGIFLGVNPSLITSLSWTDYTVQNGTTYEYSVCAVDTEGYISLLSNALQATPIAFPFDAGFLVVDETRDGNGAAISPFDLTVDTFYDAALQGFEYTQWDVAILGMPALSDLCHHPVLLWHCDEFTEMLLQDNLDLLGSYVLSGGKLLVSGWNYPSVFTPGFLAQFLPGITPTNHNNAIFVAANSEQFPPLLPDPAKLAAVWNNMLPKTYTFPGAQTALYTAQMNNAAEGDGYPAAIRIEQGGTMVLLGFPLYFMQEEGVRGFLQTVLPQLYPPLSGMPDSDLPLTLHCYPNPFNHYSGLKLEVSGAPNKQLRMFNLKGQLVFSHSDFTPLATDSGNAFRISASQAQKLSSGCYIIKVDSDNGSLARKVVLLK